MSLGATGAHAIRAFLNHVKAVRNGEVPSMRNIDQRIISVEERLAAGLDDPLTEVKLIQERMDLLTVASQVGLEDGFIAHVAGYSERHKISYQAWRELGVEARLLTLAGMKPTGTQGVLQLGATPKLSRGRHAQARLTALDAQLIGLLEASDGIVTAAEVGPLSTWVEVAIPTAKWKMVQRLEAKGGIVVRREGSRAISLSLPPAQPEPVAGPRPRAKRRHQSPAA